MPQNYTTLHPPVAKGLEFNDAASSTTLQEGMFVILDDTLTGANQSKKVTRPGYSNIGKRAVYLVGPQSGGATDKSQIQAIPVQEAAGYYVKALCDRDVSEGDILGPHIDTHYARPGALFTRWGLRALEDGAGTDSTPVEVQCELVPDIFDQEYADKHIRFFDHFENFSTDGWTITSTDAGVDSGEVYQIKDAAGSILRITTNDADNDSEELQLIGERWKCTADKPMWFEARWALAQATESDVAIGLSVTNTAVIDGAQDNILFRKNDGDTNLDFDADKGGTASTATGYATLAADTFVKTGFYWDGNDTLTPYVDGTAQSAITSNLNDDELMRVTLAIQAGAAAATSLDVDYVYVNQHT